MAILDAFKKKNKDVSPDVEKSGDEAGKDVTTKELNSAPIVSIRSGNSFVIKQPLISEKAVALSDDRKYVFLVDRGASASEVRKAVESIYKVTVDKVNMITIVKRKPNRRSRTQIKIPIRKAVVTLSKGQELDIIPK